jgi:BMFP domain-containing protein YqiC
VNSNKKQKRFGMARIKSCTALFQVIQYMHHGCAWFSVARQLPLAWPPVLHSAIVSREIAMLDPKLLEDLSARISAALAATPVADIEKNLRALLVAQFAKLDLVTREDFEVQKELLARGQARLAQLEARLAELEGKRKP